MVDPKCNHKCLYKRKTERDWTDREVIQKWKQKKKGNITSGHKPIKLPSLYKLGKKISPKVSQEPMTLLTPWFRPNGIHLKILITSIRRKYMYIILNHTVYDNLLKQP